MKRLRNGLLAGLLIYCLASLTLITPSVSLVPFRLRFFPLYASSQPLRREGVEGQDRRRFQSWLQKSNSDKKEEEDLDDLHDDLSVLTRVSEQLMMNQLALRSFRCQERIVVQENNIKPESSKKRELVNDYEVKRKAETRVNPQLTFVETRKPQTSNKGAEPMSEVDFPVLERPFSGFVVQSFSFENRLANDFKKAPNETVGGRDCLKFGFETVPELSSSSVSVMGDSVTLRQKGFIWLDSETNRMVRLSARLTKLPKGCKAYEYDVRFSYGRLFDKEVQLPTHIQLKVKFKNKSYQVEQLYEHFEPL